MITEDRIDTDVVEDAVDEDPELSEERRISEPTWKAMEALYESGTVTMADLSRTYGSSPQSMSRRFKRLGIKKGSKAEEIKEKVVEKVAEAISKPASLFAEKRQERIEDTKTEHYNLNRAISVMLNKIIAESVKDKKPIDAKMGEIKALRQAAATLAITRKERWAILEVDTEIDEDNLPEITISDLTDEEILILRTEDSEEEDEETVITEEDIDEIVGRS